MAAAAYSAAALNTASGRPVTGRRVSRPIRVWVQLPSAISHSTHSVGSWHSTCVTRRAAGPKRSTSMVTPMCWCSRSASTEPRKIIQTKASRDSSSDTLMPELNR